MTGGGLPYEKTLTNIEEKLLQTLGLLVVEGLKVVELGLPTCKPKLNKKYAFLTKKQPTCKRK